MAGVNSRNHDPGQIAEQIQAYLPDSVEVISVTLTDGHAGIWYRYEGRFDGMIVKRPTTPGIVAKSLISNEKRRKEVWPDEESQNPSKRHG